jgi:hypothetical protein
VFLGVWCEELLLVSNISRADNLLYQYLSVQQVVYYPSTAEFFEQGQTICMLRSI